VHAKGSFIYAQLWAFGRAADLTLLASEGHEHVGPSPIPLQEHWHADVGHRAPRALTVPEIKEYVQLYVTAAKNATEAGFDGIEIHGANGYLVDQFLQDVSNSRTDEYGGSVENRTRFALEVVDAVVAAIGASKTAIRLSPWSEWQGMRMADPIPTFSYYVSKLKERNLAYIHVIEPRINGVDDAVKATSNSESNDVLRKIWGDRPYIAAGGFTRTKALDTAEEKGGLISFGRLFIANPDLPRRLQEDLPLTKPDRAKYYLAGNHTSYGYTDWQFVSGQDTVSE